MKNFIIFLFISAISLNVSSQNDSIIETEKRNCITIGILQGGGSLVGADFEFLLGPQFGMQIGAGLFGFGGGLNYHLKPSIRSSFLSLQYWNQGFGDSFTQNVIGASYVYRANKWFTFQIGLGAPLSKGPGMPEDYEQPPVMLLYSIGAYIPI